ncbi:putative receptor protein kinase ZmPK1 [Lycium ferocissimum]|uniref:putative receptor protein kinase ZmPK1 n=1 Tax=Lycium ferocissimum TaxID=112874 RepID=UPI0028163A99|nr:putative receptor protein kinase ZmPK1 [Lycium ferocissimum]
MKSLKLCHLFPFLVLSFLILSFPLAASRILFRGDSLSVKDDSDFITSPEKTFTCGFYPIGSTNAYYFGIWFTNSRNKTVVWNAKQDRPVNLQGSKLTLRKNGALVLTDVDDTIVWQTNTTSFDTEKAELLETGNLVLKNPRGDILWQSFDLPTDTLLPNQYFTKSHRLVPPLRKGSFSPGYFSLYFDSDNVLRMIYDGPQVSSKYWPNPDIINVYEIGRTSQNSTRLAYFDKIGRFFSSDRLQFNVSDMGLGILRRMTIDIDGNLRIYSLDNSTGLWKISWQAVAQPCVVHGICGRFSICTYATEPKCTCPPGYQMSNASDWSEGCSSKFSLRSLINPKHVKFVEIPNVDYWGFDLNFSRSLSLESCRELCLEDPSCLAFVYRRNGEGTCFTKGILFNGYRSPGFPGNLFLKVPMNLSASESGLLILDEGIKCGSSPEDVLFGSPSMYVMNFKKVKWIYLYLFCSTLGGIEILFFVLGWWALFSKHGVPASIEDGYKMVSSTQFRRFTYTELKKATKNFKVELGRGSSGAVYKGDLADGRAVAVKKLANDQFQEEFFAEMTTIGRINHMNLVRMWGFCSEGRHQLLVYEYIENSSLDRHLFNTDFLGWEQRFGVALGTAKGLAYLHHECLEWVIHCDVKPENILLDGELEPKIADFGLAKLSQRGGPGSEFTKIRGTKGYMAPEWALNQPITAKVDVYAFGIVIFEMVKGSRLSSWVVDDDGECDHEQESQLGKFVGIVKRKIQSREDSWVDKIVDPRLEGKFGKNQAVTLIEIGISCVEQDRNKRPTMAEVVQTLLDCEDEITVLT